MVDVRFPFKQMPRNRSLTIPWLVEIKTDRVLMTGTPQHSLHATVPRSAVWTVACKLNPCTQALRIGDEFFLSNVFKRFFIFITFFTFLMFFIFFWTFFTSMVTPLYCHIEVQCFGMWSVDIQIPVEQVQGYLEEQERQKTDTIQCDNKPLTLIRSISTLNYNTSYYHSSPSYSSCLMTSPTSEHLSVYHSEQLNSCHGTANASGVIPLVSSNLKPEIGLMAGDVEFFYRKRSA